MRAGNHKNDEDKEEEAKQVIKLVFPDSLHESITHISELKYSQHQYMIFTRCMHYINYSTYTKDEEELNKHGAKWQNSCHQDTKEREINTIRSRMH